MNIEKETVSTIQSELEGCRFVKTILMLLVVLYHGCLFWSGNWFLEEEAVAIPWIATFAQWLNSFHIYAFTLVSGYLFYYLKCEQGKYEKFLPFIKNKAKRLLIPYAFVAIIWVVPVHLYFYPGDYVMIAEKYILATAPSQLWFLVMLFDVFLLFWPASQFFKKFDLEGLIVVVAAWAVGALGAKVIPNYFMIWTALQYIPLFWVGFKLRQNRLFYVRKISRLVWIILDLILFLVWKWIQDFESILMKLLWLGLGLVLHIVGALTAFFILQSLARKVHWKRTCFPYIEKRSMTVYLLHQQIVYFFIVWLNGRIAPSLHMLVNVVGSIAVSLLLSEIFMKFKLTRFLLGEK